MRTGWKVCRTQIEWIFHDAVSLWHGKWIVATDSQTPFPERMKNPLKRTDRLLSLLEVTQHWMAFLVEVLIHNVRAGRSTGWSRMFWYKISITLRSNPWGWKQEKLSSAYEIKLYAIDWCRCCCWCYWLMAKMVGLFTCGWCFKEKIRNTTFFIQFIKLSSVQSVPSAFEY